MMVEMIGRMRAAMIPGMISGMMPGMTAGIEGRLLGRILSNSITAVYLILAVVLIRILFRKAPASFRCILWGLVGLRLVLPFDIQVDRGILPSGEAQLTQLAETAGVSDFWWIAQDGNTGASNVTGIPGGAESSNMAGIPGGTESSNGTEALSGTDSFNMIGTPNETEIFGATKTPNMPMALYETETYADFQNSFFLIWLTGVLCMLGYLVWQYISLRRRLQEAVREERIVGGETCEIYLVEGIQTPFLFGVFRPGIYLPYRANEDYTEYVLRHEQMHRKHFDHLKKAVSFILLSIYWFHPFVWLAYILYGRDLELACDERVIRDYDLESRKKYSKALLYFAANNRRIQICPLAFGEVGIRERIQNVLDYKKPAFRVVVGAVVVLLGAFGIFFLNRGNGTGVNDGANTNNDILSGSGKQSDSNTSDMAGEGQIAGKATNSMQPPSQVAQEYTLIQDTRIENPYFSLTVPEEFVGNVGYQVDVDSAEKSFSVTFVLDEMANKVTKYGMLGEYEQLQETGGALGWVYWQDLKDIVWLDKGSSGNEHACFILACLDEVDFEQAWPMYSLLFGYGGERNALCYNADKSGAYCAFLPTDVQYDPENAEETKQYQAMSDLFAGLVENGDFETAVFPFERLTESEQRYLDYVKEKYGTEDAVIWLKKSEPYNYEIAKEQGWLRDE